MSVCFPPSGLSFGFNSAAGLSFEDLAKASGELAFCKKGECLPVSHFSSLIHETEAVILVVNSAVPFTRISTELACKAEKKTLHGDVIIQSVCLHDRFVS